jgi:hypothetical protein
MHNICCIVLQKSTNATVRRALTVARVLMKSMLTYVLVYLVTQIRSVQQVTIIRFIRWYPKSIIRTTASTTCMLFLPHRNAIYIRHVWHVKCWGHILVSIDVMTSCYTSDITMSLYALLQQCWPCITVRISELKTCSSNPCLHGGACIDGDNGFTCDCTTTGYYGQLCQHISLTPSKNCYSSLCVSCVCVFL